MMPFLADWRQTFHGSPLPIKFWIHLLDIHGHALEGLAEMCGADSWVHHCTGGEEAAFAMPPWLFLMQMVYEPLDKLRLLQCSARLGICTCVTHRPHLSVVCRITRPVRSPVVSINVPPGIYKLINAIRDVPMVILIKTNADGKILQIGLQGGPNSDH
jgi:hypothetical protein